MEDQDILGNGQASTPYVVELVKDQRYIVFLADDGAELPDSDVRRELRVIRFELQDHPTRSLPSVLVTSAEWLLNGIVTAIAADSYKSLAAYVHRVRSGRQGRVTNVGDVAHLISRVCDTTFKTDDTPFDIVKSIRTASGDWEVVVDTQGLRFEALVDRSGVVVEWRRTGSA